MKNEKLKMNPICHFERSRDVLFDFFRKKNSIILLLIFIFTISAQAQYFQQEVNYKIDVKLDDVKHELQASETIEYINNSPNTLTYIYFHLWPNAYKNDNTAFAEQMLKHGDTYFYYADEKDKGYIDGLNFTIDGIAAKLVYDSVHIDIAKLILNQPLPPGGKVKIETPFHVKIPASFSRLGHIKQQYQITQWYPKPAVYDQYGWHPMPYLNLGEFYSEFGSFDVSITLPKNYVVGATGNLITEDEIKWMNDKVNATQRITNFPQKDSLPKSDTVFKTIRFTEKNIHDFAWFADKRYNVMKSEVKLPNSGKTVTTWALFNNSQSYLWKNAVKYVNDAVYYYSLWNGDYPYNHCTAVDGALSAGGGMEYPTITVISATGSAQALETVILHEVGHNWFYGILGSNERDHAWMDEGINTFNEMRYMKLKYPNETLAQAIMGDDTKVKWFNEKSYKWQHQLGYLIQATVNEDQPCDITSNNFTDLNYGVIVYSKTGQAFEYLQSYLGDSLFDKCMQTYFEKWKFKHPYPNDIQKVMEEISGKKLDWFFNQLLTTTKKIDFKITSAKKQNDGTFKVNVKSATNFVGPVSVTAFDNDKMLVTKFTESTNKKTSSLIFPAGNYSKFIVDPTQQISEINRNNNIIRTSGLLKRVEPIKFKFIAGIDNPNETEIYYTPIVGWNNYNKWMLGIALYNPAVLEKKFNYVLAPMFAFGNKDLAGYANAYYHFYPNNFIKKMAVGFRASRFAYNEDVLFLNYTRIVPELNFTFRNKDQSKSYLKQSLSIRSYQLLEDDYTADYKFSPEIITAQKTNHTLINQVVYSLRNDRAINPFNITLDLQQNADFAKISSTINYAFTVSDKKEIVVRLFAGTFIDNSSVNAGLYRFRLSGFTGFNDYLYDHPFFGRNETKGILSQQFVETDGGFKLYSFIGQTTKWLTTLNIKVPLPGPLPIRLYADAGFIPVDARLKEAFLYNAGVNVYIVRDFINIYVPLFISEDFKTTLNINNVEFLQRIRFSINLDKFNVLKYTRNIASYL